MEQMLLFNRFHGESDRVEKESLRIRPDGYNSHAPHPQRTTFFRRNRSFGAPKITQRVSMTSKHALFATVILLPVK